MDYQRGKETILLVDDEDFLRNVLIDLLGQLGYQMLSAANGTEALEVAAAFPGKIDLLLTDVMMEPISGPALAEELLQSRPDIKVVFISGYADASLAPDGILKPGTILVQKPFTVRILSSKLQEIFGQGESRQ